MPSLYYGLVSLIIAPLRIVPFLYTCIQALFNFVVIVPIMLCLFLMTKILNDVTESDTSSPYSVLIGVLIYCGAYYSFEWVYEVVINQVVVTKPLTLIFTDYLIDLLGNKHSFVLEQPLDKETFLFEGNSIHPIISIVCYVMWQTWLLGEEQGYYTVITLKSILNKIGI